MAVDADPSVLVFFGSGQLTDAFTLDDPVKGLLDGGTYLLGGDVGSELRDSTYHVSVARGRSREMDEFQAGTCTVDLRNFDDTFNPLNTAGAYYGNIVPGKEVRIYVLSQQIFAGNVEDWNIEWSNDGDATASFSAVDALGGLGRIELAAFTATADQLPGARLTAVLNRAEVNFGANRNIETGVSVLQGDAVAAGTNALNYCQLVARSDDGRMFADPGGVLTYYDRHHVLGVDPLIRFVGEATPIVPGTAFSRPFDCPFHSVTVDVGSELLYTRVTVTRDGGTIQTADDATAQAAYGIRTLDVSGTLQSTDAQADDMAEALLGRYKTPEIRVSQLTVNIDAVIKFETSGTVAASVLAMGIGDPVEVTFTPPGGTIEFSQALIVEGVAHDVSVGGGHIVTLSTSLFDANPFVLDDPVSGLLDTGGHLSF